jgi:hypothetical protein
VEAEHTKPLNSGMNLLDQMRHLGLLEVAHWEELRRTGPDALAPDLARSLVERGLLTDYQAGELLAGRGDQLVMGQYCLLEPLGGGGMGQVFKAWHRLMSRTVALKVIRDDWLAQPEAVQRFRREIQAAARLSHPHIVTAHDAVQIGDRHCLVMEFCAGQTLDQLVKQHGRLSVPRSCAYLRHAALGLQHAHERGLIHRDLKPHNLLLHCGAVKILDFGLARVRQPHGDPRVLTRLGTVMGTPDYMAPEQTRDLHAADARSDLYSLGCTFFFLLTAQPPFVGGSLEEKLLRQQLEPPPELEQLRPEVPAAVIAIVNRLLEKTPARRVQTAQALAAALEPFADDGSQSLVNPDGGTGGPGSELATGNAPTFCPPVAVPPPVALPAASPSRRRRRWLLAGAGAGSLLLLVVLGVVLLRPPANEPPPPPAPPGDDKGKGTGRTEPDRKPPPVAPAVKTWKWAKGPALPRTKVAAIRAVALAPDGKLLAVAVGDRNRPTAPGEVQLWVVDRTQPTLRKVWPLPRSGASCVAFSADGALLAWGVSRTSVDPKDTAGVSVTVWDVEKDREAADLPGHQGGVVALAFAPAGSTLATVSLEKGTIRLWDLPARKAQTIVEERKGRVSDVAFSGDGRTLALGDYLARAVRLWDVASQRPHAPLVGAGTPWNSTCVAMSPDGKIVAVAYGGDKGVQPGIKLWDLPGGQPRPKPLQEGITAYKMAFTPDGQKLLTGSIDHLVRQWNVASGELELTLEGHGVRTYGLALSRDGAVLATGGDGSVVRLWFRETK